MLKLQRIFKNYQETGSFNEQVNLYGFIDSNVFLKKSAICDGERKPATSPRRF